VLNGAAIALAVYGFAVLVFWLVILLLLLSCRTDLAQPEL
jgi:hypothetical protein